MDAEAGASICVGTWPPALNIFENLLRRGKMDESRKLSSGKMLEFERIYPLDAAYDRFEDAPEDIRTNKRYVERGDFSIAGLATQLVKDFGENPLDILVHSLANGPEVKKPLLETSRAGYLAAVSVSAYSLVGLLARLGPLLRKDAAVVSLTYMASERVVPNYNVMALAKAALENSVRYLANDLGPLGIRVNAISAGPVKTASARAITGFTDMLKQHAERAPLRRNITVEEVGKTALYLCSDLASGVTGTVQFVDAGYHILGI